MRLPPGAQVIEVGAGSILDAQVEAIVNPANCVGAMGAGLALEIRRKWPTVYDSLYQATCDGIVHIGSVHWSSTGVAQPRWVIHLPTKLHWRNPSKLEWVEAGMQDLVAQNPARGSKICCHPGTRLRPGRSALGGSRARDQEGL